MSACLAGFNTRHDGGNRLDERVKRLVEEGRAIPVCPEALAGLLMPRPPVVFDGGDGAGVLGGTARAVDEEGVDRTEALIIGAEETLSMAVEHGIRTAVLKDGSPSCGVTYVHCTGGKREGRGVTAELLTQNGIEVITVDSI